MQGILQMQLAAKAWAKYYKSYSSSWTKLWKLESRRLIGSKKIEKEMKV